jgi:hypothetical protein
MMVNAALSLLAGLAAANASEPNAAGWPCPIPPPAMPTLVVLWPGERMAGDWRSDPAVSALVAEIAPRNRSLEEAVGRMHAFADGSANRASTMPKVAAGLIDTIGSEQQLIVTGIRRFNARQAILAKRIEQGYARRDGQPQAAAGNDADPAEEQMEWDTRIFEDRQRLLPVMCKLPTLLGDRLVALVAAARDSVR